MKKLLIAATALSGLLAFAGSASAADLAVPVDPVYDWTGFYIGATAGYGWGDSQHCDGATCSGAGVGAGPEVDSDGFMGGATLGYNYQLDQVVMGIEADYMFADVEGSSPSIAGYGCSATNCHTDFDGLGTARARLGFAFDNLLPYITGGVAFMDVEGELGTGSSDTFVNAVAGLGMEYAFGNGFTVKAEYLHVFDNGDRFVFNPGSCAAPGCSVKDVSLDVVRLGVNFQF